MQEFEQIINDSRRCDVIFYQTGRIDINVRIAKMLDLFAGDVVDVYTDGIDFYLYKKHDKAHVVGKHEGLCYKANGRRRSRSLRAYSRRLASFIMQVADAKTCARLCCGEMKTINGKNAISIITRNKLK